MDGSDVGQHKAVPQSGIDTYLILQDMSDSMQNGNFQDCKRVLQEALCPPISDSAPEQESERTIPDNVFLALREFGEPVVGVNNPCDWTEMVVRPGLGNNRSKILEAYDHPHFGGVTPLTKAIRMIPGDLARAKGPRHVIIFSDGDGNCPNEDACNALRDVQAETGADITLIGLRGSNQSLLDCINNLHNPNIHAETATSATIKQIFEKSVRTQVEGQVLKHSLLPKWARFQAWMPHWLKFGALAHQPQQQHCNCHSVHSIQADSHGKNK